MSKKTKKKTKSKTKSEDEAGEQDKKDVKDVKDVKDAKDGKDDGEQSVSKRGRAAKEPPPPKLWRIEGRSPEGMKVTLGRFITKEEGEVELQRLRDDGFYEKLRLSESAI